MDPRLGVFAALVTVSTAATSNLHQAAGSRPNILLILQDDFGWNDVGDLPQYV